MNRCYSLAGGLRTGAVALLMLLTAPGAWAQFTRIYYTQGSSTAALDAAKAVNPDGTAGTTLASAAASFAQPTDIAVDKANGFLYVTDQYVGTGGILRFTTAGGSRTQIVPPTASATYNGLALDAAANKLYFTQGSATDPTLDALKVVNLTNNVVTTLAAGSGNFFQPTDLALNAATSQLYVTDQFTTTGAILRFTTAGGSRAVIVPGIANSDYNGLALDAANNRLFFTQGSADPTLDALKVVNLTSLVVTPLAAGASNFTQPTDLAYEPTGGLLYLTDQFVGTGGLLRFTTTGTGRTVLVPPTAGATYNGLALSTNIAPIVTTSGGNTTFTQSVPGPSTPVAIDPALTVSDADNSTLASATVSITGNYQSAEDVLAFSNVGMGNIAVSSNAGGVLTLASAGATATVAQWQAALRAVTYTNTAASPNTGNRTVSFVANDGISNSNTATKTVVLSAAITVTSVSAPANATYRTGQNLDFVVNFSGAVVVNTGGGTPSLPLTLNTGGTVAATYLSGSGTSALTFRYTVASGNLDPDGVTLGSAIALNGGTIQGAASQAVAFALNGVASTANVLVDGIAPTVLSSNRQTPAAATTNATTLVFRVTFSEGVNGVGPTDFSLTATGTAAGTIAFATLVSSSVYDVTVTGVSGSGTLRLDLNSSGTGITDIPGNAIGGGYTGGQTYTLDHTAPTAAITSTASPSTSTSPIPITVTFSESVTGFSTAGITVGNGTLSGFGGSGTIYTFSVTPGGAGTVTVDVAANAAQDAATNGNVAAPQFSIQYTVPTTQAQWNGSVSTDWFDANNWTGGVPTAALDALIPAGAPRYPVLLGGTAVAKALLLTSGGSLSQSGGTLDLKGDFVKNGTFTATGGVVTLTGAVLQAVGGSSPTSFWNLTVGAAGATLSGTVQLQRVLTLTGSLATAGQPLVLLSGPGGDALVVNSGGTVVGAATVQRYIDPALNGGVGYRHYSAPVQATTVADLATAGFTPLLNQLYNGSSSPTSINPFPTVYGYDQARLTLTNNSPTFDKGWFSPVGMSDPLTVGQGYTVNIGAGQLVDFVGTLNNGDVPLTLARNSGPTAADAGWQFLGNPYPAPLDYSLVLPMDRPGLDAAIYVYSSTGPYVGQYRSYVNLVGGNPVVPMAQGFFTRVSLGQTSGSITFRNSQRLTAPNGTTFQRTTAETRPLLQLTMRGAVGTASDDTYVYFQAGATAGIDPQYDAVKLPNPNGLNLASVAVGTQLAINALPTGSTATVTVPLTVGLPATGTYTLQAAQVLNFTTGAQPFLHDLLLNTFTDLSRQPTYTFTMSATNTAPRFELLFGPQQVLGTASGALAAQVALFPNPAHLAVTIQLPASLTQKTVAAALVDAVGRVVLTQMLAAGAGPHTLSLAGLAAGVYSLRLQTEAGVIVKKMVIE
ncbi:beta strand repeat-containing protein [Hymenobacter rubidus]|uniref:beta strand repeat-containing protein n=1 Tax=Hymenobacter rubidus TaxID=1441626 RepID=UPI0019203ABA|nr:Ig-like domain-containing protein [Hymenobacter rubidus]